MPKRAWIVFALVTTLLAAGGAGASSSEQTSASQRPGGASARAYGIQVIVPGQAGGATATAAAPQDTVLFSGGFSCCDGLVTSGSITASATSFAGTTAGATGTAQVDGLSLFGGEVTASVVAKVRASARPGAASGDLTGSSAIVNGVAGSPGQRVPLGDWGYVVTLAQGVAETTSPTAGWRATVTGLDIHLTADHGGLPAGTQILAAYAEASAQAGSEPPPPKRATPTKPRKGPEGAAANDPPPRGIPPIYRLPPDIQPKLAPGGYVFPVYGPSSFTNTFQAPRANVVWHHGEDIFASLGAPILAVADGTVFSVGWNDVGGNRFWLRDRRGNEFYYAHLSAFTPLAVNGALVKAGDVLGFVGNTGDAQGTPYHLHFEIHPLGLLSLGYDGVVDPSRYLLAWQHLQEVRFDAAAGWAPAGGRSSAPEPGAILLQVSDISSASGLDPGSLRRAMAPASSEGDGALVGGVLRQPPRDLSARRGG